MYHIYFQVQKGNRVQFHEFELGNAKFVALTSSIPELEHFKTSFPTIPTCKISDLPAMFYYTDDDDRYYRSTQLMSGQVVKQCIYMHIFNLQEWFSISSRWSEYKNIRLTKYDIEYNTYKVYTKDFTSIFKDGLDHFYIITYSDSKKIEVIA